MARGARTAGHTGPEASNGRYAALGAARTDKPGWHDLDPTMLGETARSVAIVGDAILIGATSDGGALKIVLFHGDAKRALYAPSATEADDLIRQIGQLTDD